MLQSIKNILSVDDSDDVRHLVKQLLEQEDLNCYTAASGEEALDVLRHQNIDVVLLDIDMPEQSGIEVLKEIRQLKNDIKVIMLTACNEKETVMDCFYGQADDYLLKPIAKASLINKLIAA